MTVSCDGILYRGTDFWRLKSCRIEGSARSPFERRTKMRGSSVHLQNIACGFSDLCIFSQTLAPKASAYSELSVIDR